MRGDAAMGRRAADLSSGGWLVAGPRSGTPGNLLRQRKRPSASSVTEAGQGARNLHRAPRRPGIYLDGGQFELRRRGGLFRTVLVLRSRRPAAHVGGTSRG